MTAGELVFVDLNRAAGDRGADAPARARTLLGALGAVVLAAALTGLCAVAVGSANPAQAAGGNVDFTGTWDAATGGWVVTSQDQDGNCTGTSDYAGDGFTNCHVSGASYSFDVTSGSYVAHNTGTITGDDINDGNFHDPGGDHAYTAHRSAGGPGITGDPTPTTTTSPTASPSAGETYPTSLQLICTTPASPSQLGACTATVGGSGNPTHPYPTGSVSMAADTGTLYGSTCTLSGTSGAASAPSCTLPYQPPAGGLPAGTPVPVSASYAGDGTFRASSGTTRLYGYAADPDSDDPLGVCVGNGDGDGDEGACSGYDAAVDGLIDALQDDLAVDDACPGPDDGSAATATRSSTRGRADQAADQGAAALAQCRLRFQEALSSQDTTSLSRTSEQRQELNNLLEVYGGVTNEHTGNVPGDYFQNQRAAHTILQALKDLRSGVSPSPEMNVLINGAAKVVNSQAHDNQLLDQLPDNNSQAARHALGSRVGRRPRLHIAAALDFALARHPSRHDRAAFLTTVAVAYASHHSIDRVRARETLITARLLGAYKIRLQLTRHGNGPRRLVLVTGRATIPAGRTTTTRLHLPRLSQRALLVLALTPGKPANPVLEITQRRNGHVRTARLHQQIVQVGAS